MSECSRESTLAELVEAGNVVAIQSRLDRAEQISRDYENRCKAMAYEQSRHLEKKLEEKEATIQALLKCIRLLGGDHH